MPFSICSVGYPRRSVVTLILVKRIGAMLLLGVISFLLIAPVAMAQDPESQLPACCRTHGKHHCMMSTADASAASAGVSLRATRERCPLFPRGGVLGCYHGTVTLTASQQFFAGVVSHPPQLLIILRSHRFSAQLS